MIRTIVGDNFHVPGLQTAFDGKNMVNTHAQPPPLVFGPSQAVAFGLEGVDELSPVTMKDCALDRQIEISGDEHGCSASSRYCPAAGAFGFDFPNEGVAAEALAF